MEFLDSGHFASGFGDLDAVCDEDGPAIDAKDAGVDAEDQSAPGAGEFVQIQGGAVEEVQEPVVAGGLQTQGAHDTGDAQQFLPGSDSRQTERHPQKGSGPGAGGPQTAYQQPPIVPEHARPPEPVGLDVSGDAGSMKSVDIV